MHSSPVFTYLPPSPRQGNKRYSLQFCLTPGTAKYSTIQQEYSLDAD